MANADKVFTTRVTSEIGERAKANLKKQGLTVSEYLRMALASVAEDQVQVLNFYSTPEALQAKKEVETGEVKKIGTSTDFRKWMNAL